MIIIRRHWNITESLVHDFSRGQASRSHIKHKYNLNTISLHEFYSQGSQVIELQKVDENLDCPNTAADSPMLIGIYPKFIETSCKSGGCCCRRKSWTPRSEEQKLSWEGDGWNTGLIVCTWLCFISQETSRLLGCGTAAKGNWKHVMRCDRDSSG